MCTSVSLQCVLLCGPFDDQLEWLNSCVACICGLLSALNNKVILQIMKSIDTIKTISGPVYDLGQDSKHSCSEVTKTVDRIKTLAYPGD